MTKIILVWLTTGAIGVGISLCINMWLVQCSIVPILIGTFSGTYLVHWTHDQVLEKKL